MSVKKTKLIIIGAAGRDFHNFNVTYRDNTDYEVVAFTAAQIPDIDDRKYPKALAGKLYPQGIPIYAEEELESLIFSMLGSYPTMIKSVKPVVSVTAVRTGCGKSQTTRAVVRALLGMGKKVVSVRHPMPYGDLEKQKVQRFAKYEDLIKHKCTIEEIEEYEPHIAMGSVIYSGVDYEAILRQAEKEADVVVWDGGNNDMPFYKPDFSIVVVDPLRPGHEIGYYPGEVNVRMADVIVVNKVDSAYPEDIEFVLNNVRMLNKKAMIVMAASSLAVDDTSVIYDKNVLVVEDGPTLTHGEMEIGAGTVAARRYGAAELVDPRPYIVGKLKDTFKKYPDIGILLPAMGYGEQQLKDLEATINKTKCDSVVIGTPINLGRYIKIKKPNTRVYYELTEISKPTIGELLKKKF